MPVFMLNVVTICSFVARTTAGDHADRMSSPGRAGVPEREAGAAQSPKLLLHIGPHKTGSSLFQSTMSMCTDRGLYKGWLTHDGRAVPPKAYSDYAHLLQTNTMWSNNLSRIDNFPRLVQQFLNHDPGQKIVSAEFFETFGTKAQQRLASDVSNNDVTVVFVYRNPVSRTLSTFNQANKRDDITNVGKLQSIAYDEWTGLEGINNQCRTIGSYVSTFGRDRVKVIDMDGVRVIRGDMISSILAAAGFPPLPQQCQEMADMKVNPSSNLDSKYLLLALSKIRNNTFTTAPQQLNQHMKYLKRFTPPRRCSNLTALVKQSRRLDTECRELFGDIFLHANSEANFRAMHERLPYCEVDVDAMLNSSLWRERLAKQHRRLENRYAWEDWQNVVVGDIGRAPTFDRFEDKPRAGSPVCLLDRLALLASLVIGLLLSCSSLGRRLFPLLFRWRARSIVQQLCS